ncbi:SPOR domain-containing protein [Tahibacter amnicola]|uniref:SPOR domain-containing protein n=1 Tax=Tahibacter amnicola TaxID=2976241 RepID=A0ABY6BIX0_9GAMM|nr:SPOR domain-containing protein [Tahibacter amnicola]UXI67797.1 SPOR domain-containing protein [Tahibacter amnicola]
MFLRALFMLLLALNLGAASWLYFMPKARQADFEATDAGITRLELLAEREPAGDAANSELAEAPVTRAVAGTEVCRSIGPLPSQADVRNVMNKLAPLVRRIQSREARTTQPRGYWVYIPALASREQALGVARQLSTKGVRDYYVVTAGDQQNTISLGLFRDQNNAERRRTEIAGLGFTPQLIQRTEDLPVYWIDFAEDPARPVNWHAHLSELTELKEQPVTCF